MQRAFLGVDLGTSSAKAVLLTEEGRVVAKGAASIPTHSFSDGRVEQVPDDWWNAAVSAVRACLSGTPRSVEIAGLGFSGHMSVLLPLDRHLRPLRAAITIADARGSREAEWLNEHHAGMLASSAGNLAVNAFTLPKLLWYRTHERSNFLKTKVIVGTKDYLRLRATDSLAADPTDAGNTLLLDLASRTWNTGFMEMLELPNALFPPLRESLEVVGAISRGAADDLGLTPGLPVITGLADMAASVLGAGMVSGERIAITLGTSGQITQVVDAPRQELLGRFTYHPHALPGKCYVMASLFTGGLGLQWFAEVIASITGSSTEAAMFHVLDRAAHSAPGARGVTFLPFLTGSGSPEFDAGRRGSFIGLGRSHDGSDLSRAVLEGVSFSIRHNLEELSRFHAGAKEWVVGGGGMRNLLWRQITADVTQKPLRRLLEEDGGPFGTALAVGIGLGAFRNIPARASSIVQVDTPQDPSTGNRTSYEDAYSQYRLFASAAALEG